MLYFKGGIIYAGDNARISNTEYHYTKNSVNSRITQNTCLINFKFFFKFVNIILFDTIMIM